MLELRLALFSDPGRVKTQPVGSDNFLFSGKKLRVNGASWNKEE